MDQKRTRRSKFIQEFGYKELRVMGSVDGG
jgi:hypothetical protein